MRMKVNERSDCVEGLYVGLTDVKCIITGLCMEALLPL